MDIIIALIFALAIGLVAFMLVDTVVNDETTIEEEIIKLTTLLPSTDKMYIIDYHEGTVIFVDNTNEVVEHCNYISSVDLYDGADDLVYSANSLQNFIKAFGMEFLSINTVRKAEYYDNDCHLDLYANEIIGQETIDEENVN